MPLTSPSAVAEDASAARRTHTATMRRSMPPPPPNGGRSLRMVFRRPRLVTLRRSAPPHISTFRSILSSFRRNGAVVERWLILAILTFARTVMGFQFQSVAAISPFLIDQLHMSYAALGTLIGLYLLPGAAVAIPGGVLAQRFG